MDLTKKRTGKKELPELCIAVKRLREAAGLSQAEFARRLGITVTSISRFENGRNEPRDPLVLRKFAYFAKDKGQLDSFREPFRKAIEDQEKDEHRYVGVDVDTWKRLMFAEEGRPRPSLREWRLTCAARLALHYFPESVAAIESAAGPALSIIDQVLSKADANQIDYDQLDRDIWSLADRQTLMDLRKDKK